MILLYSHVRTGRWASVMPARLAATLGLTDVLRAIPIVEPEATHTIGLGRTGARADDAADRGARRRSASCGTTAVGLGQQLCHTLLSQKSNSIPNN